MWAGRAAGRVRGSLVFSAAQEALDRGGGRELRLDFAVNLKHRILAAITVKR
jgi:hypothetical protein